MNGKTVRRALGRHGVVTTRDARRLAREWLGQAAAGEVNGKSPLSLRQAWSRYRGHLIAKGRSERSTEAYELAWTHVSEWLDTPLARLADDPDLVAERHQKITGARGPIIANRVMQRGAGGLPIRPQAAARPGTPLRASMRGRQLEHGEAGYITRSALLPHLFGAQERVSAEILEWVRPDESL